MPKHSIALTCAALALATPPARLHADDPAIALGDAVPRLTFTDTRYLPRSLDDFGKKDAYVIVFTATGCPLVERYLPVLQKLESAYRDKDVQFLALNVGA